MSRCYPGISVFTLARVPRRQCISKLALPMDCVIQRLEYATHSLECPGPIPSCIAPSFVCAPGVVGQSVQVAPNLPQSAQDAVEEALRQAKEQAGQAERDLLEAKVLVLKYQSNIYSGVFVSKYQSNIYQVFVLRINTTPRVTSCLY